jgi:hypothetical protein
VCVNPVNPRLSKVLDYAKRLDPGRAYAASQLHHTTPVRNNAGDALHSLDAGFDKRVDDIKPGHSVAVNYHPNVPKSTQDVYNNPSHYAGSSQVGASEPAVMFNPNADRSVLAHELGHIASQQTDVGHLVGSLRANPKLSNALMGAMLTLPGVASALEAGDDDMDTAIATSILAASPKLVDEALASKNALAIMNNAGMRATLGQRGRLAGGLMTYLAAPILAGVAGNTVGNMLDSDY